MYTDAEAEAGPRWHSTRHPSPPPAPGGSPWLHAPPLAAVLPAMTMQGMPRSAAARSWLYGPSPTWPWTESTAQLPPRPRAHVRRPTLTLLAAWPDYCVDAVTDTAASRRGRPPSGPTSVPEAPPRLPSALSHACRSIPAGITTAVHRPCSAWLCVWPASRVPSRAALHAHTSAAGVGTTGAPPHAAGKAPVRPD